MKFIILIFATLLLATTASSDPLSISPTRAITVLEDRVADLVVQKSNQAILTTETGTFLTLSLQTGEVLRKTETHRSSSISAVAISPTGRMFAYSITKGNYGYVRIVDAVSNQIVREFKLDSEDLIDGKYRSTLVVSLAFSGNERYLVSAANPFSDVTVWEIDSGERLYSHSTFPFMIQAGFSADHKYFIAATASRTYFWSMENGELIYEVNSFDPVPKGYAITDSMKYVFKADHAAGVVKMFDVETSSVECEFPFESDNSDYIMYGLQLSPSEDLLAGATGGKGYVWDVSRCQLVANLNFTETGRLLRFVNDDTLLSADKALLLFDLSELNR